MPLTGSSEIVVDVAPERVWAMLADIAGWRAWMPGIRWAVLEKAFAAGGYVTLIPLVGRRQTAYRIDAVVEPRMLALGFTIGPVASLRTTWTLEPDGTGTRLTYTVEVDGPFRRALVAATARKLHDGAPALLEALRTAIPAE
jgi:uncharacterized protein YndB with AHSA1/START domain